MVVKTKSFRVHHFGLSDIGLVRQKNEDVWAAVETAPFYILADGMGGHKAGDVAAQEAVTELSQLIEMSAAQQSLPEDLSGAKKLMHHAISTANGRVYKLGQRFDELHGMGTTLCCIYFVDEGVVYGHVGDSRIYLFRKGSLIQITRDHSLLSELLDKGQLKEQQAPDFQFKNIVTKAIGADDSIEPALGTMPVHSDDLFMMCSDGLTDMVTKEEIEQVLHQQLSLETMGHTLISMANARGGHDNITIVLMQVVKESDERDLLR